MIFAKGTYPNGDRVLVIGLTKQHIDKIVEAKGYMTIEPDNPEGIGLDVIGFVYDETESGLQKKISDLGV